MATRPCFYHSPEEMCEDLEPFGYSPGNIHSLRDSVSYVFYDGQFSVHCFFDPRTIGTTSSTEALHFNALEAVLRDGERSGENRYFTSLKYSDWKNGSLEISSYDNLLSYKKVKIRCMIINDVTYLYTYKEVKVITEDLNPLLYSFVNNHPNWVFDDFHDPEIKGFLEFLNPLKNESKRFRFKLVKSLFEDKKELDELKMELDRWEEESNK